MDENTMGERYAIFDDLEDPDEAAALAAVARRESMLSRAEAVGRANAHLEEQGTRLVVDEDSALPNPRLSLWVVSYIDPQNPDETLTGGGLVVPSRGPVYDLSSAPGQPEMVGVVHPGEADGLPADWAEMLSEEYPQPYWAELVNYVASQRREHEVYPPQDQVFEALHLTPWEETRVVMLGQDPYHGPGQAHGLSFSVNAGVTKPPALRNIYKELHSDLGISPPDHGNLEAWARRGVLLLNTTLTVRRKAPKSHQRQGWERVTDALIRAVNEHQERVVFVLWGQHAQSKARLIDTSRHAVVASAHPTSWPGARVPFPGSKPFSKVNQLLCEAGRDEINWDLGAQAVRQA